MTIKIGDKLPAATFFYLGEDGPAKLESADLFDGKKIVLFAVPGAFTPTCHLNHLPGYLENLEDIKAKGVDEVVVVSVNDPFVMGAWAKQTGGKDKIKFLGDSNGAFTKQIGMGLDGSPVGLIERSQRYSMIVENGTVTALNLEEVPSDVSVSGAAAILSQL